MVEWLAAGGELVVAGKLWWRRQGVAGTVWDYLSKSKRRKVKVKSKSKIKQN
jgi:hypothetical protein